MSGALTVPAGAGVDASIPLRAGAGVAQPNPLETIGHFANIQNALNQAQLFPQTLAQQQQHTAQVQRSTAYGFLAPMLALPPEQWTHQTVTDMLGRAEHAGAVTQPILADLAAAPAGDGAALSAYMRPLIASQMQTDAGGRLGAVVPATSLQNTGQAILPVNIAPPGAPVPGRVTGPGGSVPIVPSVSDLATPVTYTDANGVQQQTTKGEYAARRGIPPESLGSVVSGQRMPGLNEPLPPTPVGGRPAPGYTGRYPQPTNLTATSGPAPGTEESMKGSAAQYVQDRAGASTFASRVLPLKQAIGLLSETNTGPGSETANYFRSVLVSAANQGLLPKSLATSPSALQQATFDELKKYMAQYITGMPFAGGSDARMAEAVSGSPNVQMATLANKDVAKVLVGVERFRAAQVLAFDQAAQSGQLGAAAKGNPNAASGQYATFATKFNQATDPRAFAYDLMAQPDRAKMLAKMTPEQRTKFATSLKTAYGLPGLMQ